MPYTDDLPFSPAAERNAAPILDVLNEWLPGPARVLEVASGTGQHAAHFAQARPDWHWQPTEAREDALAAIAQRCAGLANVAPPCALDIAATPWQGVAERLNATQTTHSTLALAPESRWDTLFCANLLHIAPWPCTSALMANARRLLASRGLLVIYGPFWVDGETRAPSNLAFDADLRSRNPAWGIRDLRAVVEEATGAEVAWVAQRPMPANNVCLVFQRAS